MSATVTSTDARPTALVLDRMSRGRRLLAAWAGPALIVGSVLFALRGFVFHPLLTNSQVDVLSFWLPRFAFLGRSISSGHIPLWNPYEMAGYRFAADPQSGWLYAPAMLLFSALNPGTATRALIVFNPMLGGLGLYAFCRREGLARVPSTAAGLSTAMIVSTSEISISLPFAGMLAWTPVVLWGAAGFRGSELWSRRLAWLALGAFGWSQVAAAHMSHGLVMCTLLVGAYLIASYISDVRHGNLRGARAVSLAAIFMIAMPLCSLALLIPHLSFIGSSSLHAGYNAVGDVGKGTSAGQEAPLQVTGTWAGWPFTFATAPGQYAGAVILLAVPLALRARRWRHLTWAFGVAFLLTYASMLQFLLSRGWFQRLMLNVPFGDVYVHNPGRFRYVGVIAIPLLGAVGIQGLLEEPMPVTRALAWLAAGIGLWLVVPIALGGIPIRFALFAAGALVAIPIFVLAATRKVAWAAAGVVAVLVCELLGSAYWSQHSQPGALFLSGLEPPADFDLMPQPLTWPNVSQSQFLAETPLTKVLNATNDRYLTWAPPAAYYDKGYLFTQRPQDWPSLVMERGTLFSLHDTLGYNPVQLPRYWSYIRQINPLPVFYNASVINDPSVEDIRMLGVRYLIVPTGVASPVPGSVVATDGGFDLIEISGWQPRVSVVPAWTVATPSQSLADVVQQGFDPGSAAVLESNPGLTAEPGAAPGTATYSEDGPEHVIITADATAPSIVVVRTSYDAGWSAKVDGRTATVVPADFLLQGIPVGPGHHRIDLTYHDPDVTLGMWLGIIVWLLLLSGIAAAVLIERRRRPDRSRTGEQTHQPV